MFVFWPKILLKCVFQQYTSNGSGNYIVVFSLSVTTKNCKTVTNRFRRYFDTCIHKLWADPGFPRGGGANPPGKPQHTILPNFTKNCMKLKEFGLPEGGGHASLVPPWDPPMINTCAPAKIKTNYQPQIKLRENNVFTNICHSIHEGGVWLWVQGVWLWIWEYTPPGHTPLDTHPSWTHSGSTPPWDSHSLGHPVPRDSHTVEYWID